MCGICGFIYDKDVSKRVLEDMIQTIHYRGPDDAGVFIDHLNDGRQIGLAHRRLSILDLSQSGHQPMLGRKGNTMIVFNGEIYNFKVIRKELEKKGYIFSSQADTEVILYAYEEWGIDAVKKMNGMFAFALWDREKDEFYLVRDRMGVKPLYYYQDNHGIVFASELKPIMSYPYFSKEISKDALKLYLYHQYITGPATIFKHVYKLEPGQILKMDFNGVKIIQYWSVEETYKKRNIFEGSLQDAEEELRKLLLDATALRMISDVPLGGFLSGGVDSSLIVALMKELSDTPVKTFTIGFKEKEYNEASYAKKVAEYLGTEHYDRYLSINETKDIIKELPLYFDEPMADSSAIATMLVSRVAKEEVTVALSGDAGDELFCGYSRYDRCCQLEKYKMISKLLYGINRVLPIKMLLLKFDKRNIHKLFHLFSDEEIINSDYSTYWDRYAGLVKGKENINKYYDILKLTENLQMKNMLQDMVTYLPDDILTKVDRASMSISLETRAPLLDYRVVEFALSLPHEYKYWNGDKKHILKELLYSYVPRELMERPKKGFSVPISKWVLEDYKGFVKNYFDETYIKSQGIFDYKIIQKIVEGFLHYNNGNYAKEFWTLLSFQMWYDFYMR